MESLSCMSELNPSYSFSPFDAQKVHMLAKLYPNDILGNYLLKLDMQLENYIVDMTRDESFHGLENIVDLSVKLLLRQRGIKCTIWFTCFSRWY
jgi:hypothetical protein